MSELGKLLEDISGNSNAKLWELAKVYKLYKEIAHIPLARGLFEVVLGKDLAKAFDEISGIPGGPAKMDKLVNEANKWESMSKIGPDTGKSLPVNPADLWLKGLDNMNSGLFGGGLQLLGEHLHPNDPQKANALGDIGKTIGTVASTGGKLSNAKQLAKEFGKPDTWSKQLLDQQNNTAKGSPDQKNLDSLLKDITSLDPAGADKSYGKADTSKPDNNKADFSKDFDINGS